MDSADRGQKEFQWPPPLIPCVMPPETMKPRISAFAILILSAIFLIIAGGLFFRSRAQEARHRRLASVQNMLERNLIPNLDLNSDVISMKEFDVLDAFRRNGVTRLLYLDKRAEHRYFLNEVPSKRCFDCIEVVIPYSIEVLDAVEKSWETHTPTAIRYDAHENDVIIPLASKERPLGMVLLRASDSVLTSLPDVSIVPTVISTQNRKHLKKHNPNRQVSENTTLSAREYRRKAEAMFPR